jgi:hypothetical protein
VRKITDEEIRKGFAPLKTFLRELSDISEIICNMSFSDADKAESVENTTVVRIIKRCGRSIADATSYALRNPARLMRRLSPEYARRLTAAAMGAENTLKRPEPEQLPECPETPEPELTPERPASPEQEEAT